MSDHELDPPPGQPLPAVRKQAIRTDLLALADDNQQRSRGWVVPSLAAAAAAVIVTGGVFAATRPDDSGGPGSQRGIAPGAAVTKTTPPVTSPVTPTTAPTVIPTKPPPTGGHGVPAVIDPITDYAPSKPGGASAACANEVAAVGEPGLEGATVTAERNYGLGVTMLYETKSAWVVCDTFAALDGGAPTLLATHQKSQPYEPDKSTLALSENFVTKTSKTPAYTQFFAGGRDFDGVQAIAYRFPDGQTEDAVVGMTGLWSMVYLPTDGPLTDPAQNQTELDPITVTVDYTSGDPRTFTLAWGLDTCAQTNHGC